MPELFPPSTASEDEMKRYFKQIRDRNLWMRERHREEHNPDDIEIIAKKIGAEFVGGGGERRVYKLPNGKLIGIYTGNSERSRGVSLQEMKRRFYIFKILHILFPENFPLMYSAGERNTLPPYLKKFTGLISYFFPSARIFYDIKEYVPGETNERYNDELARMNAPIDEWGMPNKVDPDKVKSFIDKMVDDGKSLKRSVHLFEGIGLKLWLDDSAENFIGKVYIDSQVKLTKLDDSPIDNNDVEKVVTEVSGLVGTSAAQSVGNYLKRIIANH